MARDITKQKSVEQKLASSEERFRDLTNILPQIVFETDREANCTFINDQGSAITGSTQNDFPNSFKILDLVVPEERDRWAAKIAKILAGATYGPEEFIAQRQDGSTFPISTNMVAIKRNNEITGLRGVALDITERKHLEERLLESQRIETMGTLASGIAHDINNVLATIGELGSLLYGDMEANDPKRADVEAILTMTQRGGAFLRNLLGFARPGSGIKKKFSLNQMVDQAAQLLRYSLSKKISIITDLAVDLHLVEGDQNQLFQVLMNLCINAGDALENGGTITITTRNKMPSENGLDSGSAQYPPQVELIVQDNGMGMDAETQRKAFEPFYTTKDSNRGTGLGLFMVRAVVLNHGGQIYIESEKGMGTRVLMALPAVDSPMGQVEPKPIWQSQRHVDSCTVLLVEDEDLLLTTGTRLLKKLGHKVLKAQNGAIALKIFSEQRENIDLVILDLEMPVMGGAECFEKLLEMDPSVKVLVTTGFATAHPIEYSHESGTYGFLQKPFTVKELDCAISNMIDQVDDHSTQTV
jgi:PAS domain S-box-containing protein